MVHTFVDSALGALSALVSYPTFPDSLKAQIRSFQVDLRFLQMFLRCLITLVPDSDIDRTLISGMLSSVEGIWDRSGEGLYNAGLQAMKKKFQVWNRLSSKLGDKIQQCKPEIKKYCVQFMSSSFQSKPFPGDQILIFLDEILNNSNNLVHLPDSEENQFQTLREKLLSLRHIVDFAARRCPDDVDEHTDFMIHAHTWGNKAACLTCLYWASDMEDEGRIESSRMNLWIADLLREVNPCTSEFIQMCFAAMKSSRADATFLYNEFVISFTDFMVETMALEDFNEALREDWIFFISYLTVPPADHPALTFHPAEILLLGDASDSGDLTVDRAIQPDFSSKIRSIRGRIEELHVWFPDFILPTTDRLGFVDRLLGKIEHLTTTMECNPKIAPFAKHISKVEKELTSLCQSIIVIWEELLQGEHEEHKDLLDRMIDVAYQAELAVNSSFTIDHPIWYHLSCLSYVLVKIKDIQNEFGGLNTNQIHGIAAGTGVDVSKSLSAYMPPHLELDDEIVVGFEDEEQVLIDRITRGTPNLDIVPIVGIGGLGKTTLARKLFNKPLVRYHFHVYAFCCVGPDHDIRRLLHEILREIITINDVYIRSMTEDDLAFKLYQCLKGRRYLIIMDDIWDVTAWEGVKQSFPNDSNGSRIVFTTRSSYVPQQVKSNCTPHYLRFLSIEESWELLQAKVFHKRRCPLNLQKVGLLIAEKCNGLPLAVVVIAGLLAREPESRSSWKRIADDLSSHASTHGCMYTLELSYMRLPEALKSCLLYFGAFLKKKNISAKRLMLLWAAEGFAPKSSESSSFLSMATQYLNDLVHRSLVIVAQRSSTGGIKRCEVHDLVREFCQNKAREEHFFHFIERSNIFSMSEIYQQYRLCIHVQLESEDNAEARNSVTMAHTLIYYCPDSPCSVDALPFCNIKLVQVLDVKAECKTFPEEVTMLVNLRYFTLKTHTLSSFPIPSIIARLWNLETFVLKCFPNKKICLPETIWKMKRLKHVDVGREAVVELDNEVGKDSSKLHNIESFSSVTINYGESGVELLRRLSNVRKLSCCYYTCLDWQKKFEQLPKLDEYLIKLESLNVVSDGAFYPWVPSFPRTLKKLSLEGVDLPWSEFYAIAELPCLEVLKLMTKSFRGSKWSVVDLKFPNLTFLKLYGLDVEKWIASRNTFPWLEQIVVKSCYNLVNIPVSFAEVPTLTVIEVYDCKEEVGKAAIEIQEEQLELGNMIQVQVITQ